MGHMAISSLFLAVSHFYARKVEKARNYPATKGESETLSFDSSVQLYIQLSLIRQQIAIIF